MNKKVLCLIPSFSGGGAERQMIELIGCLNENDIDVTVITNSSDNAYPNEIRATKYVVDAVNKYVGLLKTYVLIRRLDFDSVVAFGDRSNLTAVLSTFPFKCFQLIVSERNFTLKIGWKERMRFFLFKRADFIVANSNSQTNFILNNYPALRSKVYTIHNYTDIVRFKPERNTDQNLELIKVGVFARYAPQKNISTLIKAAAILKETGNNVFRFHWFGKMYLEDEKALALSPIYENAAKLVLNLGLEKEFKLHSFSKTPERDIHDMDVISLPSFHEGFSNSLSEALACGKPIIASDVSDNPFIVEDSIQGFLFDPYNVYSVVDAFKRYNDLSIEERRAMSISAREKAEKLFSKDAFGDKYIRLIK